MSHSNAVAVLFRATVINFHSLFALGDTLEALEQSRFVISQPDADLFGLGGDLSRLFRSIFLNLPIFFIRFRF